MGLTKKQLVGWCTTSCLGLLVSYFFVNIRLPVTEDSAIPRARSLFDASRDATVNDLERLQELHDLREAAPPQEDIELCTDPIAMTVAEAILTRREEERRNTSRNLVGACVLSRDEAHLFPEWIAYHYAAGVDLFIILDDESEDGIVDVLKPFTDAGFVQIIERHKRKGITSKHDWKPTAAGDQMRSIDYCYQTFTAMNKRREETGQPLIGWIVQGDVDEYTFALDRSTLGKALSVHNNYACALVHRVQYGGGDHKIRPAGLTIENYFRHASPDDGGSNRWPKCFGNLLAPPSVVPFPISQLKSPHTANTYLGDAHNAECKDITPVDMRSNPPDWKLDGALRMNHYALSLEDYVMKMQNFWSKWHDFESPSHPSQWEKRNAHAQESSEIVYWACATRKVLVDLKAHVPVTMGIRMPKSIECIVDAKGGKFCLHGG